MTDAAPLHLFERIGIELEYMLVDADTLAVRPFAERILPVAGDRDIDEPGCEGIRWSNELAAHVIELKVPEPVSTLDGLAERFQKHVGRINAELAVHGARLMPTGMHPWMDPTRQTRLWPHENGPVYEAFNRIFGCAGHGWANVQSVHINLPFADDEEFGRLHAAIRLILPILPALAASSPFMEGCATGTLDNRLAVYGSNSGRVPSVAGRVIPEPVFTVEAYRREILDRMYRDIAPLDPDGVLQHEWLNARGAIARFERHTIEIRLLDSQECPQADLAVVAAVVAVLRGVVSERWSPLSAQQAWPVAPLEAIYLRAVRDADNAVIHDREYLDMFGYPAGREGCTALELWRHAIDSATGAGPPIASDEAAALRMILAQGSLARRLVHAVGEGVSRDRLTEVYRALCDCLAQGRLFEA